MAKAFSLMESDLNDGYCETKGRLNRCFDKDDVPWGIDLRSRDGEGRLGDDPSTLLRMTDVFLRTGWLAALGVRCPEVDGYFWSLLISQ